MRGNLVSCAFLYQLGLIDQHHFNYEWDKAKEYFKKYHFERTLNTMCRVKHPNAPSANPVRVQKSNDDAGRASRLYSHQVAQTMYDQVNFARLFYLRVQRLVTAIPSLLQSSQGYLHIMKPIFSYIAWAFYVPRLVRFFVGTVEHLYKGGFKSTIHYLRRNKHSILNDVVWCATGAINCAGLLGGYGIILTAGLYLFDAVNIAFKHYNQIAKLEKLKTKIKKGKDVNKSLLIKRIDRKLTILKYNARRQVGVATSLLLGMSLAAVAAIAVCPPLAIVSASIVVTTCLYHLFNRRCVAKKEKMNKKIDRIDRLISYDEKIKQLNEDLKQYLEEQINRFNKKLKENSLSNAQANHYKNKKKDFNKALQKLTDGTNLSSEKLYQIIEAAKKTVERPSYFFKFDSHSLKELKKILEPYRLAKVVKRNGSTWNINPENSANQNKGMSTPSTVAARN